MKNKLLKIVFVGSLVLLVPFLIGRVSVIVLDRVHPAVELPTAAERCRELDMQFQQCVNAINNESEEVKNLVRSLARARAMTRITLILIGVYYVALIAGWLILRRRKKT